jgi:hypothetical protein
MTIRARLFQRLCRQHPLRRQIYPSCAAKFVARMAHLERFCSVSAANFESMLVCIAKTFNGLFMLLTTSPGCCGAIVDPANVESWTCELCQNEETLEASLVFIMISSQRHDLITMIM